jgi:RNAse (barnase) inhibitor barstar
VYEAFKSERQRVRLGGGVFASDDYFRGTSNAEKFESYYTFDLGAWYDLKVGGVDLSVSVSLINATDEEYFLSSRGAAPQDPRSLRFRLAASF